MVDQNTPDLSGIPAGAVVLDHSVDGTNAFYQLEDGRYGARTLALDIAVTFPAKLPGSKYDTYISVVNTTDANGKPKGSLTSRLFAAAFTVIHEWESEEHMMPVRDSYDEEDITMINWVATVGQAYINEKLNIPFRSSSKLRLAPPAGEAPPDP